MNYLHNTASCTSSLMLYVVDMVLNKVFCMVICMF